MQIIFEPRSEKPVYGVSDQFRHKPVCTATEDNWRLDISDLRVIIYKDQKTSEMTCLRFS